MSDATAETRAFLDSYRSAFVASDAHAIAHTNGAQRFAQTLHLPLSHSAPLVVAVEGDKQLDAVIARRDIHPFAFINPIWLVKAE